jgi:RimJ/RimL family protein N-acetyltransferase
MIADHLVFRCEHATRATIAAPEGYTVELWRPSLVPAVPPHFPRVTYGAWWLFHRASVFHNRDYAAVIIWRGDELAHRLGIFPGWFRFPFMARDDLQLGDLWTAPGHRGRGLAAVAVRFAMANAASAPGRSFWYLTHAENSASIRTANKAGFSLVGRAVRTRRWGLRLAGQFLLETGAGHGPLG